MKSLLQQSKADLTRPYEKCLRFGCASLSDAELLAVILRCGTKGTSATHLAQQLLESMPHKDGLLGLVHSSVCDLTKIAGIGEVKAIQLKCIGELSKRISMQSRQESLSFCQPESVAGYYMERLRHEEQEELILVMLDTKSRLIADRMITKGTVNASLISVREVFLNALKYGAVSILLLHNHPSGDATPSEEDIRVTEKVHKAGEMMDIPLLDHIVIGDQCYVSFAQAGLMKGE